MGEPKRKPGRPRKWASDAERMRATRAAKSAEREETARRAEQDSRDTDRWSGEAPARADSPVASASRPPASAAAPESIAEHTDCEATVGALRRELLDLEERYDDLVLSGWILTRSTNAHSAGCARTIRPASFGWSSDSLSGSATSRRNALCGCRSRTGNWCGAGTRRSSSGDSNRRVPRRSSESALHPAADGVGDLATAVFGGLEVAEAGCA
jgi:hypothetical protein